MVGVGIATSNPKFVIGGRRADAVQESCVEGWVGWDGCDDFTLKEWTNRNSHALIRFHLANPRVCRFQGSRCTDKKRMLWDLRGPSWRCRQGDLLLLAAGLVHPSPVFLVDLIQLWLWRNFCQGHKKKKKKDKVPPIVAIAWASSGLDLDRNGIPRGRAEASVLDFKRLSVIRVACGA